MPLLKKHCARPKITDQTRELKSADQCYFVLNIAPDTRLALCFRLYQNYQDTIPASKLHDIWAIDLAWGQHGHLAMKL